LPKEAIEFMTFMDTQYSLCKTLVRPILTNGSESWPLKREVENMLLESLKEGY
jgi:hypothetical protein